VGQQQRRRTHRRGVTPIDPVTASPENIPDTRIHVIFTPNGDAAIIVAEARKRLDFRDPQTMAMKYSIDTPQCAGNHADFSIDGRYVIFTCEFAQTLAKIDLVEKSRRLFKIIKGACLKTCAPDGKCSTSRI
jgi:hypothetical protein